MGDPYRHYQNKYQLDRAKLMRVAKELQLSEPLQKLVLRREIYAKRVIQPVTLNRRSGVLDQPGRPKTPLNYVAQADPGDYLVQQDGEDVIAPAAIIETMFVEDEPTTVSIGS